MDCSTSQPASVPVSKPALTVVAALIMRNAKLLVCQRRRDDSHGLEWEFPGGKVESGESHTQALARELREELGVDAVVGDELYRTRHRYADSRRELELIFLRAEIRDAAELQNLVFEQFQWADISDLPRYAFLDADKELIELLANHTIPLE